MSSLPFCQVSSFRVCRQSLFNDFLSFRSVSGCFVAFRLCCRFPSAHRMPSARTACSSLRTVLSIRLYQDVRFMALPNESQNNKSDDSITIASLTSVCYAKPLIARLFSRFPAATPISDFAFCRSSDLSIHVQKISPRTNALLQPSLGAMTALPMTGFHRAQISLHGKQYFRNTATFGILPSPLHSMIHRLQTERRDSFRVRDSHPIPLFSEQECVSDCSGRAFATKAMLFSLLYARLFYAHKKTSPALLSRRQKKSRILCIFGLIARKKYQAIRLVGCKFYANYLYFCNHFPCLRTFPFQNLHTYHTANRSHCKACNFYRIRLIGFHFTQRVALPLKLVDDLRIHSTYEKACLR